jgi:hypothetical protein
MHLLSAVIQVLLSRHETQLRDYGVKRLSIDGKLRLTPLPSCTWYQQKYSRYRMGLRAIQRISTVFCSRFVQELKNWQPSQAPSRNKGVLTVPDITLLLLSPRKMFSHIRTIGDIICLGSYAPIGISPKSKGPRNSPICLKAGQWGRSLKSSP